jgi:hypothetical protein
MVAVSGVYNARNLVEGIGNTLEEIREPVIYLWVLPKILMKQGELDCWSSVPAIMLWCILFFVVPVALARPSDPIVS